MADFSAHQRSSGAGWVVGAAVVVLLLLFIVFGSGSATSIDPTSAGTGAELPNVTTPAPTE